METYVGVVQETTYRNEENGYCVLRVGTAKNQETVVGILPALSPGENVTFEGEWTEHAVYGKQFSAKSCVITPPEKEDDLEKYLGGGFVKGIGPATAKLIVKQFGTDTLRILDEQPERLIEIRGIGPSKAAMILENYRSQMATRQASIFLGKYGINPNLANRITKYYGEDTIEMVRQNPYRMVLEIDGVGFLTADRIALSMGVDPHSEFRVRAALHYLLTDAAASSGHTYLPAEELIPRACEMLQAQTELVENQLKTALLQKDMIAFSFSECENAICLPSFFYGEAEIAHRLALLMNSCPYRSRPDLLQDIASYEEAEGVRFSQKQKEAIRTALEEGVLVITGGPGTGKTTIIRCILTLLTNDRETVLLSAPTGRAAKRMEMATGKEAKTIHRLLEYSGETEGFAKDEDDPLDCHCLIVDEMSMVDVFLMKSLLRALQPGTRLILVGDSDQLPSVGAGNVLRDILDSEKVPTVRLTDIFRQDESSMIVWNAHLINSGEMPELRSRNTDFFFERKATMAQTASSICALASKRLPKFLKLPEGPGSQTAIQSIQVLTPMKKGECGAVYLNRLLQDALNPDRPGVETLEHGETVFRTGDKVIQTKNDYQREYTRHTPEGMEQGTGVYNGDVGYVVQIDPSAHMMRVCFDEDRFVVYQQKQLDALELAYCLTVHKSQGSEFPVVILPVVGGPPMLMVRNLLYTAVTRAKKLVVLVGREDVIRQMVENNYVFKRYTTLRERLKTAVMD